jgi:protein-tyrosine phosphatase
VSSALPPRWFTVQHPKLLGGEHPCLGGDARVHRARLTALLDLGVTTFVDLTEPGENGVQPYKNRVQRMVRDGLRVAHCAHPIPDARVPASFATAERLLDDIDAALAHGETVYLHCRSGVGRTGTVLALHLVRHGHSPREALHLVQAAWRRDPRSREWPRCPQTEGQRRYVRAYWR